MKKSIEIQQLIKFFENNEKNMYKFAYGYVKNQDIALDLIHEAIVKAIQKRETLKNPEYLKSWFYRILINECLGYMRKNKKVLPFENVKDSNITEQMEELIDKNEYIDLYDAIDQLPSNLKTIIMLRYFEDMKLDEISQVTKTNLSTIKSRLYKALRILRIDMKGEQLT